MKRTIIGRFEVPEGKDKYGTEIIEILEKYCTEEEYDFESILHLFKLYGFYPDKTNIELINLLLLRMLRALPECDFQTSLYILPKELRNESEVNVPMRLHTLLETGRFEFFWEERDEFIVKKQLVHEEGFVTDIRHFIMGVLMITYQRMKISKFCRFLNLKEEEVSEEFCGKYNVKVEENLVCFPLNRHNEKKAIKRNKMTLEQLGDVISSAFE